MKKGIVITIVSAVCILTAVIGIFVVKNVIGKKYDFDILGQFSFEQDENSFVLEEACTDEIDRNYSTGINCGELCDSDNFFETYVKDNKYYLFSLDGDGNKTNTETGEYIFFQNNNYYYCYVSDDELYGKRLSSYTPFEDNYYKAPYPFFNKEWFDATSKIRRFSLEEPTEYSWDETVWLKSFDDLVDFYGKFEDYNVTVNEEEQSLTIPLYTCYESYLDEVGMQLEDKICEKTLKIQATEEKIIVTFNDN